MTRIGFMGTPDFAVPTLRALAADPRFEIVTVVTQPDRPAGRGQAETASAVKREAQRLGLPVFQPPTLRDAEAVEHLRKLAPDVMVVAAFGQILRRPVLELAPYGCINVHASLLPRWRGAAPIQYAICAGDTMTGITIMKMDAGLDTGPILGQIPTRIDERETASRLHDRLAGLAAQSLPDILTRYLAGEIVPAPQPETGVRLAPTLKKEDGEINWSQSAENIDRMVRAYVPWPGAFSFAGGKMLKIIAGHNQEVAPTGTVPGTLFVLNRMLAVQTGQGLYVLGEVQPAGKRRMTGQAYLSGHPEVIGMTLGER